jgi:acetylornithine deacetylase
LDTRRAVAELAAALVEAESVNPDLGTGGSGEAAAAEVVAAWARDAGLDVEVDEVQPGRPNVVVTSRGAAGGRTLMLNGHLDTVSAGTMERPFEGRVEGNRLYGRGSYDMKGALAAALVAAARAHDERLPGDVLVACVIDEEYGSLGTERLVETRTAAAAIVCEPTDERIRIAHKGFAGFEVEMPGQAAHGSRPDLGVDAIAAMAPVLTRLGELSDRLGHEQGHPLLGPGSVHASLIEGGQEYSSYPARCLLTGERRLIPGEAEADVVAELEALVAGTAGSFRLTFGREPFEIAADHGLPELVAAAARAGGFDGIAFWTDAALLAGAGIPTVLYGPAGEGAHADEEWIDLASLERCCDTYLAVARSL